MDLDAITSAINAKLREIPRRTDRQTTALEFNSETIASTISTLAANHDLWIKFSHLISHGGSGDEKSLEFWKAFLQRTADGIDGMRDLVLKIESWLSGARLEQTERDYWGQCCTDYKSCIAGLTAIDPEGVAPMVNQAMGYPVLTGLDVLLLRYAFNSDQRLWNEFREAVGKPLSAP